MKEYKKQEELNGNFKDFEGFMWVSLWYNNELETYDVVVSKKKIDHLDRKDICYHAKSITDFDIAIRRYQEVKIIIGV